MPPKTHATNQHAHVVQHQTTMLAFVVYRGAIEAGSEIDPDAQYADDVEYALYEGEYDRGDGSVDEGSITTLDQQELVSADASVDVNIDDADTTAADWDAPEPDDDQAVVVVDIDAAGTGSLDPGTDYVQMLYVEDAGDWFPLASGEVVVEPWHDP